MNILTRTACANFLCAICCCAFSTSVLHAAPRAPYPPWPEKSLSIFGWDEGNYYTPMRFRAIGADQARMVESWSGYSLVRLPTDQSPVAIPALDADGRSLIASDTGAVRFWFDPNWSSVAKLNRKEIGSPDTGPGQPSRLLELVNLGSQFPDIRWTLYANAEGNQLMLSGIEYGQVKQMVTAPLNIVAGQWVMLTLCYSPAGSQIWANGQLLASGSGIKPGIAGWEDRLGLVVGSSVTGSQSANGQFEEVVTFDYWPGAEQQQFYYRSYSRRALLGPVGSPEEEQFKMALVHTLDGPPSPGEGGGSGGSGGTNSPAYNYDPGTFYVELLSATNDVTTVQLHNTVPDVMYELRSVIELTNGPWTSEQFVIGAVGATSTVTTVPWLDRTNTLFLQARSWVDTDGDGLPDWWEAAHGLDPDLPDTGNTGISDGYKDGDGDGWSNLEEFQNGTDPASFDTPPPPNGLLAAFGATTTNVAVSWNASLGNVTSYSVVRYWDGLWQTSTVSAASTTLSDTIPAPTLYGWESFYSPTYQVRANYTSGSSDLSAAVTPGNPLGDMIANVVRGAGGTQRLVVSALPASASSVLLWRVRYDPSYSVTNFTIAATNFVAGVYELPSAWTPLLGQDDEQYQWYAQPVAADGKPGEAVFAGWNHPIPFFDGRDQLRQNLAFQLRAANNTLPLMLERDWSLEPNGRLEYDYALNTTAYAQAGLALAANGAGYPAGYLLEWMPFDDNYTYRNLAYASGSLNGSGYLTTGAAYGPGYYADLEITSPASFEFVPPTSTGTISTVLSSNLTQWLYYEPYNSAGPIDRIGISHSGGNWVMAGNAKNLFGLPLLSAKRANSGGVVTLSAGGSIADTAGVFYPETAQPQLQTTNYYFGQVDAQPLPGHDEFAVTNASPLLITGIGNPYFTVAGYAKQAILNGYTNKFGYLGQYFDKAYNQGTTNETGILSPYGEFLPTEPGPAELVTMPDLSTGQRGTGVVNVIKLQLDVNHDGIMDLSWGGPDNANTRERPFRFWINSDDDGLATGNDINAPMIHDYTDGTIDSQRDLEDFARLWVTGVPVLPSSEGYAVTLEIWPIDGDPRIKLYPAVETDGGIGYLTNSTTAALQLTILAGQPSPGQTLGEIASGQPLTLPTDYFTQTGNKYFLFEGSGAGRGQLILTVSRGGEPIASHAQWIDLRDVDEMYEQGLAYNVTSGLPPSSLVSEVQVRRAQAPTPDESKQVIVFVHGINNSEFDYARSTETLFKRLYWSGYRGKVAGFRWPCAYLPNDNTINPLDYLRALNFNLGEFYAFKSASAFKDYLVWFHNRQNLTNYTVNILAHSQGNIVASEAIRQGAPFANYILTQGAVPAHAYDTSQTTVPFLTKFLDQENVSPTPLQTTNGGYHGYFSSLPGNLINFYNPQDYALATGQKLGFDANWEANQLSRKPENFIYRAGPEYSYFPSSGRSFATIIDDREVTDPQEIMALVARTRTAAVGAHPSVGGAINAAASVNLQTTFGFGNVREDHSAQFTRSIQAIKGYFDLLFDLTDTP